MHIATTLARQCGRTVAVMSMMTLCVGLTQAQTQAPAPAAAAKTDAAAQAAPQPDYHPSTGDLMTMAVQPRHIKLGLAGKQQNWTYARYESGELRNAFARIGRTIPKYSVMATAIMQAPLDAVDQAIKERNETHFTAAYAQLTQVCNACHQSEDHAAVVIKIPDARMFPDQDFRPASR